MEASDRLHVPVALFPEKLLLEPHKYEAKWASEPVSKLWGSGGITPIILNLSIRWR
jgi:hypothetical protein